MDSPPPPPSSLQPAKAIVPASPAPPKQPFVFTSDKFETLLQQTQVPDDIVPIADTKEGKLELFQNVSAFIVPIDVANIGETFVSYANVIETCRTTFNPPVLASYGYFGPVIRIKVKPSRIDISRLLTDDALYSGRKAAGIVNNVFDIESQQLPGPFFVPPTNRETQWSHWSFHPTSSDTSKVLDGCVPIALVAWTAVNIHFIGHSADLRSEWMDMIAGRKFLDGELLTPFFPKPLQALFEGHTSTLTWRLEPGQVFVTHTGMPFCFSKVDEATPYCVQAIGVEVLKPHHQQRKHWKDMLTTGLLKLSKNMSEFLCGAVIPYDTGKTLDGYEPAFTPALPEKAEWLTGGGAAAASPAVAGTGKGKRPPSDQPRPELLTLFDLHAKYDEDIAKLHPRTWEPKLEGAANGHRTALKADPVSAKQEKINAYRKCLGTLEKKISDARSKQDQLIVIECQLQECQRILSAMELTETEVKLNKSRVSKQNALDEINKEGNVIKKAKAVIALLEKCTKLNSDINSSRVKKEEKKAAPKRTRASAAASSETATPISPSEIKVGEIDEDNLNADMRAANELEEFIKSVEPDLRKFDPMIKALDREEFRDMYNKLYGEFGTLLAHRNTAPNEPYNVAIISAYHDALAVIWRQTASRPSAVQNKNAGAGNARRIATTKDGETITFGTGQKVECSGADACGDVKPEYANGMCQSCFIDQVKERTNSVYYALDEFPKYIAKAHRAKDPMKGELLECQRKVGAYVKEINGLLSKVKKSRDAIVPLLDIVHDAEELICKYLGADFFDIGDNDDEEEYDNVEPMSEGEAEASASDDEVEVEEEEEEEEEEEASSPSSAGSSGGHKRNKVDAQEDGKFALADGIIRAQVRTPIEEPLKRLTTAYLKGDPDSLATVRTGLKELDELTTIYVITAQLKGGIAPKETTHAFDSYEKAEGAMEVMQVKMPAITYAVLEKKI